MWIFLSNRIRTWVLLAVLVPVARRLVRRARLAAAERNPQGKSATVLGHADSALLALDRRKGKRRHGNAIIDR